MGIREDVQAVIDGVQAGKMLETFDRWYADDVEMSDNGANACVGKAANRRREEAFLASVAEWHGAQVHTVVADADHAAIEWTLEFTPKGGARLALRQVGLQTWRNGKIVREVFHHG